jgi:flavodoxin
MNSVKEEKILVAYFSHSGNTRAIADRIHKNVGGDVFEIQAVEPYPRDYDAVVKRAGITK